MIWRITYTDPGNNSFQPDIPSGWDGAQIKLDRHSDFMSLIEGFQSSFLTYGSNGRQNGGRDWLLAAETTWGPDAIITELAEMDYNEDGNWETIYLGTLGIALFIETLDTNHFLQIVFGQQDFWAQFVARYSQQVDIRSNQSVTEKTENLTGTITPTPYFNLPLPAQIIDKRYQGVLKHNIAIDFSPAGITNGTIYYTDLQIDFDTVLLNEIDKTYEYGNNPLNANNITPPIVPFGKFIVAEDGDMDIDFGITLSVPANASPATISGDEYRTNSSLSNFQVVIQVNNGALIQCTGTDRNVLTSYKRNDGKTITLYNNVVTDYSFSGTLRNLKKNDQVRIYAVLSNVANFVFHYDVSLALTLSNIYIRPLFIWGNQGWDKNTICNVLGGESFVPYGFTDPFVECRFTSLISDAYDPSSDARRNVITNLPAFEDLAFLDFISFNDTYIVGVAGTIGSGIFTKNVSVGDFIQVAFIDVRAGSISCSSGSAIVTGSGTTFNTATTPIGSTIYVFGSGVTRDPTSVLGQVLSIQSTTQLTLAVNAAVSYSGKAYGVIEFWVSPVSLYYGLEPFGNTYLNATFHSQPGDTGDAVLNKGTTLTTNNYGFNNVSITSYFKGLSILVQFDVNNTGVSTLQINSLAVVPIHDINGNALVANSIISTLTASGTNTYVLAAYAGLTVLVEGLVLVVKFTNANTGPSTLNVNSLGAIAILNQLGGALATGDVGAGAVLALTYNGTNWVVTDNKGTVSGQIYNLTYDGTIFILLPIASTDGIEPTANQIGQAFLTHDVMSGILDRITDNTGLFYSEYLGNPYTVKSYGSVGSGSLLANLKGLQVRGYTLAQKPFFTSAQDWFSGLKPIYPVGLGYDIIGGQNVIRVENLSYFFDPTMSVLLSNVQNIKRSYDNDYIFNQVVNGYSKWQSQAASGVGSPSGIDDPQSTRTWNTLFKVIGKQISLMSGWIAASLTLETTRRVGSLQSANYTYDDDTFVVALKSNGDGTFTPELEENFSAITNLSNPASRYNSRLTPARNFLRWLDYLSGCLQSYLSSFFTFASGTGNYDMTSQLNSEGSLVNESGNIAPSNTPLFLPQAFEITHKLDWKDYVTIRNNRNKAIGVSQTSSGHVPFFIKSLSYTIATGELTLTAWPKTPFTIAVIDSPLSSGGYEDDYEYEYEH